LKSGKLPHLRTPKNANDYIFIDDVVDGFYAAITNGIPSGIYNLGSGKSTTVIDVCGYAEKLILGSNILTQRLEEQAHLSSVDVNFWAKTNTAKKTLNWSSKIALTSGIERTWADFNKL
jgi:nucleoside-diphosphate-sugar epimerase